MGTSFLESTAFKKIMAKVYGLGAGIVIVGALFKIMHWPGAGPMLIVGLGTEAVIFFISAFEPLHREDDWSLVFPQLAGLDHGQKIDTGASQGDINKKLLGAIEKMQTATPASGTALAKFDKLIDDAKMGPELFNKLGAGLNSLSESTKNMTDLTSATVATKDYADNAKKAAVSLGTLSDSTKLAADGVKQTADVVVKQNKDLASSYQMLIGSMSIDFGAVTKSNQGYSQQLDNINKNLSALNSVYELQLKSTSDSLKKSESFYAQLDKVMGDVKNASDESEKYRLEVSKLSKKLTALNDVYGKMLSAVNVNPDKL